MSPFESFVAWFQHYSIAFMTGVFVLIFVSTYWPGRKSSIEQNGQIPLNDDR